MQVPGPYTLAPGEFMSECSVIQDVVAYGRNVVIVAAPGIGKSYAVINGLKELGQRFVFLADTKVLAEDLSNSYKVPCYWAGKEIPPRGSSVITIPDHIEMFVDSEAILVVDEWHSLISDYNYRGRAIDRFVYNRAAFKQVIGLTGTPIYEFDGFPEVRVEQQRGPIPVQVVGAKSKIEAVVANIRENPDLTHYVSVFDKSVFIEKVRRYLESDYISGSILKVNSSTKDEEEVSEFLLTNRFKTEIRLIFTTYKQGFSVKGTNFMVHIVPYGKIRHSVQDIAQVAQRFRDDIPPVLLYHKFPSEEGPAWDLPAYRAKLEVEAMRQVKILRDTMKLSLDEELGSRQQKAAPVLIDALYENKLGYVVPAHMQEEYRNLVKSDLTKNGLQIAYWTLKRTTDHVYNNLGAFKNGLAEYGVDLVIGKGQPKGLAAQDNPMPQEVKKVGSLTNRVVKQNRVRIDGSKVP